MDTPNGLSTLPERAVRRAAQTLGTTRWSRRRFLTRSVVVGSALAVSPWDFAVHPASAYAAVCGSDASCAAGYSVFCCTVNNGANLCPPGSFAGGWWKADASGFCCGGPRYYVDCNAVCGSGWRCGCETSSATCDNRLTACNQFRYGQCNQQISCYGPVVCRLVTCTPPWEYDPSCSTSSATDDNTVSHTAPCLPGYCPSPIIMRYYDLGGPGSYLGPQEGPEGPAPAGGGTWVPFAGGAIFDVSPQGLWVVHGAIYAKYQQQGGSPGLLGYPITDENGTADRIGRYNHFAKAVNGQIVGYGSIYWTPQTGAWSIHGYIRDHWAALGWETSPVGYPITDENGTPDGQGRYNHFSADGSIYWTPQTGAWSVHGAIRAHWTALGWEASPVGYPITDENGTPDGQGRYNHFAKVVNGQVTDHGSIYWTPQTGAWSVHGTIRDHWQALGWEAGLLGYPITDENETPDGQGQYNHFAKLVNGQIVGYGSIYATPKTGAWSVHGNIRDHWQALGWEAGPLGYPTTDETGTPDGQGRYNQFVKLVNDQVSDHGSIYWTPGTGAWSTYGVIGTRWQSLGSETSPLGYPTSDPGASTTRGLAYTVQRFQQGAIYDSTVGSACAIYGPIFATYSADGGPAGPLGLPTTSVTTAQNGDQTATFQNGTLTYHASTGQVG
ncbi:MAG: hypothetical protein ACR2MN_18355 [Acidimicrobiales bacterium]